MHATRTELPLAFELDGQGTSRQVEWGELNVAVENFATGVDATELFAPLPGGRCQCPHWGYVIKGRMRIKYADHDEVISAGEVYYMAPGHIPVIEEAVELVEFSPRGEYQKTMTVVEG